MGWIVRCAWSVYDTALRVAPPGALNSVTPPLRLGTIALDGLVPTLNGQSVGMDEGLKLGVNLSYETRLGVGLDLCDLSWAGRGAQLIRYPLSANTAR